MYTFIQKHFIAIIASLFILKCILLPFSAHPFDFWAFVNQFERHYLFGWNLFEYWNKGNLLLLLWYPFYEVYSIVTPLFSDQTNNLYLLHFCMKLPFYILDIMSCILVYQISLHLIGEKEKALFTTFLWSVNPIVFYVYGIHGHYEGVTVFGILLLIYGVLSKRIIPMVVGFLICFTVKYFIIVIGPLLALFIYMNAGKKKLYLSIIALVGLLILSYLHFFIYPDLFWQTIHSVIHLSQPNTPSGVTQINLPPINTISALYFLFSDSQAPVNNISNPQLFYLGSHGILLFIPLLIGYYVYRGVLTYRCKIYVNTDFLSDLFLILLFLLLFAGNVQAHYMIWVVPFLIFGYFKSGLSRYICISFSLIVFVFCLRSELGVRTFFMDIYGIHQVPGLNSVYYVIKYFEGLIIVGLLLLSVGVLLYSKDYFKPQKIIAVSMLEIVFFLVPWWLMIIAFSSTSYVNEVPNELAYARYGMMHRGILYGRYPLDSSQQDTISFADKELFGALTAKFVTQLEEYNRKKFSVFLLTNTKATGIFNNCGSFDGKNYTEVFDYYNKQTITGYQLDIHCLKSMNNSIKFNHTFHDTDAALYIVNTKQP